jgi:hypothetical protein
MKVRTKKVPKADERRGDKIGQPFCTPGAKFLRKINAKKLTLRFK